MKQREPRVPKQISDQVADKCSEGLALAVASSHDGAVMHMQWCNRAFTDITGYDVADVLGKRGTILIGESTDQGSHLVIIEKLMNWEHFSLEVRNNRKNGQAYRQKMSWTPLSDPESGDRWWLCSVTEVDSRFVEPLDSSSLPEPAYGNDAACGHEEMIRRLQNENERLHDLAKVVTRESKEDPLTGLANRRHFEFELTSWIQKLREDGAEFAVFYIDLDRFKSVNDTLGHAAGDRLLKSVAEMLRRLTDENDLVARIGGDEFIVLRRLKDSALNVSSLADAIVREMHAPFTFEGKSTFCSTSIGVAIAGARMNAPEQVVADADKALYHAKANGRGRWSFFTEEMHVEALATKQLVSDLLIACENRAFVPYFQPLVDASTGRLVSVEVLTRWAHPKRGPLPPASFLETAAGIGILKRIDEITFSHLPEILTFFDRSGADIPRFTINVSAGRLADPSLIHDIKRSGIDPKRLTVEILESVYLDRIGDLMHWTLGELKDLGVTIALDDFGTGQASVQSLLKIRPSVLKIDRQFIQPIVASETSRALAASIIGIGKSLGMLIVAEGVESEQHAHIAGEMGCDWLQGFYFGKPKSADDLKAKMLETNGMLWPVKTAKAV